jgi:EmrB/QacA subfamily drug resistance transporter
MTDVDPHPRLGAGGDPESMPAGADPRRWRALVILGLVQFIIFLDATIVNVALPAIQRDLGFSAGGLTWVVNGYLLAAGGLLLVGGRLADLFGRRRMFVIGAALFAVASLTAGLAFTPGVLIVARFAQGIAEATAAPAAMSIVALLFTDPGERAKAFGIWGGLAGLGSALGVVLSGVLVELADWRWVFYVNIPLAVIPFLLARKLIDESKMTGGKRPDLLSAVLVTGGLIAVIHGLITVPESSWGSPGVLIPIIGGALALGVFLVLQAYSANPLIPLRFFRHRTRITGNLTLVFHASASAAVFFIVVLYMQNVLGYTPLQAGLAWLPLCVLFMTGLMLSMKLVPKVGVRTMTVLGLLLMAGGVLWLSRIGVDSSYWSHIMPSTALFGFGGGMSIPAIQAASLQDVSMQDAGLGSGVFTTVQQMGQALGLTVIVTVALASQASALAGGAAGGAAATSGYRVAFTVAAMVLAAGGLAALALMKGSARAARQQRDEPPQEVGEPPAAEAA